MQIAQTLLTLLLFLHAVSANDVHVYVRDTGWAISGYNALIGSAPDPRACINYCYSSDSLKDTIKTIELFKHSFNCQCATVNRYDLPDAWNENSKTLDTFTRTQIIVGSLWHLQQPKRRSHVQYHTTLPGLPEGISTHAVAIVPSTFVVPDPVPVTSVAACADLCLASAPCSAYVTNPATDGYDCTLLENFM